MFVTLSLHTSQKISFTFSVGKELDKINLKFLGNLILFSFLICKYDIYSSVKSLKVDLGLGIKFKLFD